MISRDLHPDLDDIGLRGRVVHVILDADARTNPAVRAAVRCTTSADGRTLIVEGLP